MYQMCSSTPHGNCLVGRRDGGEPSEVETSGNVLGWQTGVFVTRPSVQRARSIWLRSQAGEFSPRTNTEQDVIEAEFGLDDRCTGGRNLSLFMGDSTSAHRPGFPEPFHRRCAVSAFILGTSWFHGTSRERIFYHHRLHTRRADNHTALQLLTLDACPRAVLGEYSWQPNEQLRQKWNATLRSWKYISGGLRPIGH